MKPAMPQCVVAAVLAEDTRENTLYPQVLICLVCERMPIVAAVPGSALVECWIRVRCLADTRLDANENKRRIVEAVQGAGFELLLYRLRRQRYSRADCAKVGHNPEDPFGLLPFAGGQ